LKRKNPARSGAQYRLAQAVLAGTARQTSMSKKAAQEIVGKTPAKLRPKFSKGNPAHRKRNPEDTATTAYRDFHGKDPAEIVEVDTPIGYHSVLAGIGKLEFLDIKRDCDGGTTTIEFGKGTYLTENEKRTQLFISGGDQSISLKDFGIRQAHELEVLGLATRVGYFTEKKHLIEKDGGKGLYIHRFGYTNKNGRHVRIPGSPLPTVIYDTRNKLLAFAGGGYTIPSEGIDA